MQLSRVFWVRVSHKAAVTVSAGVPIIFIHLFVDGHLGCFHIMVIVNNAAMNFEVHISFELVFSFSSGKYSGVELVDHVAVLFLIF